jgi:hypothetical protein
VALKAARQHAQKHHRSCNQILIFESSKSRFQVKWWSHSFKWPPKNETCQQLMGVLLCMKFYINCMLTVPYCPCGKIGNCQLAVATGLRRTSAQSEYVGYGTTWAMSAAMPSLSSFCCCAAAVACTLPVTEKGKQ